MRDIQRAAQTEFGANMQKSGFIAILS